MSLFTAKLSKLPLIFIIFALSTSSAFAGNPIGGTITFGLTSATAVPTLSATMLIILSLLLFAVAFKVTKQKNSNAGKFFIMLLGVSAIGFGGSGVKLMNDAQAIAPIEEINIAFEPGTTTKAVQLVDSIGYYFSNEIDPPQVVKVISVDLTEGFICEDLRDLRDLRDVAEKEVSQAQAVLPEVACSTLPTLSSGQVCSIRCYSPD